MARGGRYKRPQPSMFFAHAIPREPEADEQRDWKTFLLAGRSKGEVLGRPYAKDCDRDRGEEAS